MIDIKALFSYSTEAHDDPAPKKDDKAIEASIKMQHDLVDDNHVDHLKAVSRPFPGAMTEPVNFDSLMRLADLPEGPKCGRLAQWQDGSGQWRVRP